MEKLLKEVQECVEAEYGRAAAKFGCTNHSDHESYAIIKEELEGAQAEMESVALKLAQFWHLTRTNDEDVCKYNRLLEMQHSAMLAACECIQVAAMAMKAALTIADRNVVSVPGSAGASR